MNATPRAARIAQVISPLVLALPMAAPSSDGLWPVYCGMAILVYALLLGVGRMVTKYRTSFRRSLAIDICASTAWCLLILALHMYPRTNVSPVLPLLLIVILPMNAWFLSYWAVWCLASKLIKAEVQ